MISQRRYIEYIENGGLGGKFEEREKNKYTHYTGDGCSQIRGAVRSTLYPF